MADVTCSVSDCQRTVGTKGARGMCPMHYKRWKATGATDLRPRSTSQDRLMAMTRIDPESGCWIWTGARSGRDYLSGGGYSAFYFDGRLTSGHRASYEIANGPIPDGLTIDHLCRNTLCVNPEHLEAVTMQENNVRGEGWSGRNAKATRCPAGHLYDEENTYVQPNGGRVCRACARLAARERRGSPR